MTRVQRERFSDAMEYEKVKTSTRCAMPCSRVLNRTSVFSTPFHV